MNEPMMTAKEVAVLLNVSIYSVYRLKDKPNGLRGYKVGSCIRFKPSEVEAYIAQQRIEPAERENRFPDMQRFKYVPGMRVV